VVWALHRCFPMASIDRLWAVVLAAGDGSRLAELTRAIHGEPTPKQFARLFPGNRSLLQTSLGYLRPLVPGERTIVVVPNGKAALARSQLAHFSGITIVEEPQNRGTGASLLLPLALLLQRAPSADVVVVPASYMADRPQALREAILLAHASLDAAPITVLGVAPTSSEHEHSLIVPGRTITPGIRSLANLVASPREELMQALLARRALWHPLFTVSDAWTLWRVTERHLVEQSRAIRAGVQAGTPEALERAYAAIRPADFTRDVVARQLGFAVTDVTGCGFKDIATPDDALAAFPDILDRIMPRGSRELRSLSRESVFSPDLVPA
jgi:mannose-1-phosphate guanylyltransferase